LDQAKRKVHREHIGKRSEVVYLFQRSPGIWVDDISIKTDEASGEFPVVFVERDLKNKAIPIKRNQIIQNIPNRK
jgi:hypothetical protein